MALSTFSNLVASGKFATVNGRTVQVGDVLMQVKHQPGYSREVLRVEDDTLETFEPWGPGAHLCANGKMVEPMISGMLRTGSHRNVAHSELASNWIHVDDWVMSSNNEALDSALMQPATEEGAAKYVYGNPYGDCLRLNAAYYERLDTIEDKISLEKWRRELKPSPFMNQISLDKARLELKLSQNV